MDGSLSRRTLGTVVDLVVRRSWSAHRSVLISTWSAVSVAIVPLLAVVAVSLALQASWRNVGRGAVLWTQHTAVVLGQPVLGRGCLQPIAPTRDPALRFDVWVAPPRVWPAVGWRVAWLPRPVSSRMTLFVPTNHQRQFQPTYVVAGEVVPLAAQLSAPPGSISGEPGTAWLLVSDEAAISRLCGAALGVFRRINTDPTTLPHEDPRMRFVQTPGGIAYSVWRESARVFLGVVIGSLVALIVLTAGAAQFWAAGQVRGWAIARLCGVSWALLRWQVVVESLWILAPGLVAGACVAYYALDAFMPRMQLTAPSVSVIASMTLVLGSSLVLTLALLLWGRLCRVSPLEGLREAREWRG